LVCSGHSPCCIQFLLEFLVRGRVKSLDEKDFLSEVLHDHKPFCEIKTTLQIHCPVS
jgi:hypothetical protein